MSCIIQVTFYSFFFSGGHPYFCGFVVKKLFVFCSFCIYMFVRTDQRVCLAEYDAICESTNGFGFQRFRIRIPPVGVVVVYFSISLLSSEKCFRAGSVCCRICHDKIKLINFYIYMKRTRNQTGVK